MGRPPKQRRCIAGGYDYLNWCTNCIYGKKKNGKFKKPCDGPRRVPMLGDDWADNNRDGVQDESGIWASPTAPPMLVGRFLKKTFQNCRGEDEEFTGAVMGYDEPYFKVLYCDGDGEDMTKEDLMPLLLDLDTRKPAFPYNVPLASCGMRLASDNVRGGGDGRSKYAYKDTGITSKLTVERDNAVVSLKAAEKKADQLRRQVRQLRRELAVNVLEEDTPMRIMIRAQAMGSDFDSARTRRRHAELWEKAIMEKYAGDVRKQVSVAKEIARRFLTAAESNDEMDICGNIYTKADIAVCVSIAESLKIYVDKLRSVTTGRMTNNHRLPYRVAAQAASVTHDNRRLPGIETRARWLGFSIDLAKEERRRYQEWCLHFTSELNKASGGENEANGGENEANGGENEANGGENEAKQANTSSSRAPPLLFSCRGRRRSDAYPPEWASFVAACWIEVSRRGEIAREELRDRDSNDPTARVRKCFLEMRVGKACEKIIAMCKSHFDGTFVYKDKVKRPKGFTGGIDYVRCLRPYYCVKSYGNRKTSLCTWCLKFEFLSKAICKHQKDCREHGHVPADQPRLPTDWAQMLRCFLCGRDDENYANLECMANKCVRCKNLRRVVGADGKGGIIQANELTAPRAVRWDRWTKAMNPVTGAKQWDFVTVRTAFAEIISEIKPPYQKPSGALGPRRGWLYEFAQHHDLAVYMARAKAHKRVSFPRGSVHVVEDFSENGTFTVKKEFQSRYWATHSYSLFGCVVSSHIEDRTDLSEAERTALIKLMDAHKLPHVIQDSHLMLSEDTVHDDIKPSSGAAAAVSPDQNAIFAAGLRLCAEAEKGDFVAIELAFENLPFLIGEVVGDDGYFTYEGDEKEIYMGTLKDGDKVLRVRRWLPLHSGGGSSVFEQIEGDEGVILAFAEDVRYKIHEPTVNFKLNRRRSLAPVVDNVKAAAGARFEYMFENKPGVWYKGTITEMNNDGATAKAKFDDGDDFQDLLVWGNLKGGRIKILEGGQHVELPSMTAPQRRLSPAARATIQRAIC